MNIIVKILIFLLVNTIGFLTPPFCLIMAVRLNLLDLSNPDFDINAFRTYFMHVSYLTFFVCMLFSFAYFFLRGREKYFFLLAPVIIPLGYGLTVILGLFGA